MRAPVGGLVALLTMACGPEPLPPLPQATIVVDTTLLVPFVAERLRVDLFDEQGRWFDSEDVSRPDPRDWPVSFTVYASEPERTRQVWVRLRIYPEGRVRDYLGERFWDWSMPLEQTPVPAPGPRLIRSGSDQTPATEPAPLVTVDRLVLVTLTPEQPTTRVVVLAGECAGTMSRLAATPESGPVLGQAESCIDTPRQRTLVHDSASDALGETSLAGSFAHQPCPEDIESDRVCIVGGGALLGSAELTFPADLATTPERIVAHRAFYVDRQEVTVGRFRAAKAQGFVPSEHPTIRDAPLDGTPGGSCSFTSVAADREQYALSCVTWQVARELCQFWGGDLPSEAQWEYVAASAGQRRPTRFPWGDEPPTCDRAVYGRLALAGSSGACQALGTGPEPVLSSANDRTAEGVEGLAGGLSEWTLDRAASYADDCWRDTPVLDPGCFAESSPNRVVRGGAWPAPSSILRSAIRLTVGAFGGASFLGFRCVYPLAEAQ